MNRLQIIGTLFILLLSISIKAQEQSLQFLHYNLFLKYQDDNKNYKNVKEKEIEKILKIDVVKLYSILEDSGKLYYTSKDVYNEKRHDFNIIRLTTGDLQHTLYYDEKLITVVQSESVEYEKTQFFHYELLFKGTSKPIHLLVYKQSIINHPIYQLQAILNYISDQKLQGDYILAGGSSYPFRMLKDRYFKLPKNNVAFLNLLTYYYLYDKDARLLWHKDVDFLYVSTGIILSDLGGVTYRRIGQLASKEAIVGEAPKKNNKNRPLRMVLDINQDKGSNNYSIPVAKIITQNNKSLFCSIVWDKDIMLNVEVVSMIGNSFYEKNIKYEGIKENITIDISSLPTGIYLIKVTDTDGDQIFTKFTKY